MAKRITTKAEEKKEATIPTKFMVYQQILDHLNLVYTPDDSIGYYKGEKFTIRNGNFVRELTSLKGQKLVATELQGCKILYLPDDPSKFLFARPDGEKIALLPDQPEEYLMSFIAPVTEVPAPVTEVPAQVQVQELIGDIPPDQPSCACL